MIKKLSIILCSFMFFIISCSGGNESSGDKLLVGVAMPTQSSERWINDAANMKNNLEKLGYAVDIQFAEDDVQTQVSQIENFIAKGVNCLVVASVDSQALVNVLEQAKNNGNQ